MISNALPSLVTAQVLSSTDRPAPVPANKDGADKPGQTLPQDQVDVQTPVFEVEANGNGTQYFGSGTGGGQTGNETAPSAENRFAEEQQGVGRREAPLSGVEPPLAPPGSQIDLTI